MKLVDQKLQIEREYHQKQIVIQEQQNCIVQQALQLQIDQLQNQLNLIKSDKFSQIKHIQNQTHNTQQNEIISGETDVKYNIKTTQQSKDAQQQYMDELNSFSVQFAKDKQQNLIDQKINQLTANSSCESLNDKLEYILNQYDLLKSQNALLIQTINDHTEQLDSLRSQTVTLSDNNIQMQNTCDQCVEEVNGSLQQYNLEITQINNHYVVVPMNSEEVELVLNEENVVVKVNAKTAE
ncbi:Hypothetical_protein [Hexamita inflata]|uniref:Hypothetical_protein n=1 Tax=Hexamita inflata TaxID=28002 RepID=A0AA86Q348_9EUKA|nr:Hypothetical protein HINF_LOCUS33067 [Hexamita inflata]